MKDKSKVLETFKSMVRRHYISQSVSDACSDWAGIRESTHADPFGRRRDQSVQKVELESSLTAHQFYLNAGFVDRGPRTKWSLVAIR